jgi:transposase InsO family protein
MNPYAEVWVQRTKDEVLNRFLVFGKSHLRHILAYWLTYYHQFRPHQGLGNVPILTELPTAATLGHFDSTTSAAMNPWPPNAPTKMA